MNYLEGELSLRANKVITEPGSDSSLIILLFTPSGNGEQFQLADRLRLQWDVIEAASEIDVLSHISKGTISLFLICNEENIQLSKKINRSLKTSITPVLYTDGSTIEEIISRVRLMLSS